MHHLVHASLQVWDDKMAVPYICPIHQRGSAVSSTLLGTGPPVSQEAFQGMANNSARTALGGALVAVVLATLAAFAVIATSR
jgi:hypothetical protein